MIRPEVTLCVCRDSEISKLTNCPRDGEINLQRTQKLQSHVLRRQSYQKPLFQTLSGSEHRLARLDYCQELSLLLFAFLIRSALPSHSSSNVKVCVVRTCGSNAYLGPLKMQSLLFKM